MAEDELKNSCAQLEQYPCPICGGRDFEWGFLFHGWYCAGKITDFKLRSEVIGMRRCLKCQRLVQFVDEAASKQSLQLTMLIFLVIGVLAVGFTLLFLSGVFNS